MLSDTSSVTRSGDVNQGHPEKKENTTCDNCRKRKVCVWMLLAGESLPRQVCHVN